MIAIKNLFPGVFAGESRRICLIRQVPVAFLPIHVRLGNVGIGKRGQADVPDVGRDDKRSLPVVFLRHAIDRLAHFVERLLVAGAVEVADEQRHVEDGRGKEDSACRTDEYARANAGKKHYRREKKRTDCHPKVAVVHDKRVHQNGGREGNRENAQVDRERTEHGGNRVARGPNGKAPRKRIALGAGAFGLGGKIRRKLTILGGRIRGTRAAFVRKAHGSPLPEVLASRGLPRRSARVVFCMFACKNMRLHQAHERPDGPRAKPHERRCQKNPPHHLRHGAVTSLQREMHEARPHRVRRKLDVGDGKHHVRPVRVRHNAHLTHEHHKPRRIERNLNDGARNEYPQSRRATSTGGPIDAEDEQQQVHHKGGHGAKVVKVCADQARRSEDSPPRKRRTRKKPLPLRAFLDAGRRALARRLAQSARDAPRGERAQHDEKRRPRVHAYLGRHNGGIGNEQDECGEQHAGLPAEIATDMRVSKACKGDRPQNREQAIRKNVLPENQVEDMQRPVEEHGVHIARADAPNLGERMVRYGNRIALIEPDIAMESPHKHKRRPQSKNGKMEPTRRKHPLRPCSARTLHKPSRAIDPQ